MSTSATVTGPNDFLADIIKEPNDGYITTLGGHFTDDGAIYEVKVRAKALQFAPLFSRDYRVGSIDVKRSGGYVTATIKVQILEYFQ